MKDISDSSVVCPASYLDDLLLTPHTFDIPPLENDTVVDLRSLTIGGPSLYTETNTQDSIQWGNVITGPWLGSIR
jgi:hypothetical protein